MIQRATSRPNGSESRTTFGRWSSVSQCSCHPSKRDIDDYLDILLQAPSRDLGTVVVMDHGDETVLEDEWITVGEWWRGGRAKTRVSGDDGEWRGGREEGGMASGDGERVESKANFDQGACPALGLPSSTLSTRPSPLALLTTRPPLHRPTSSPLISTRPPQAI